jgi:glycosyltransferase involved in cell wall biosynthesis
VRAAFGLPAEDFVILFAGKLEAKKRPDDVLRAAARLGPGVSVLCVGTGPLEEACRATAGQLGVRVAWAGFLNQSEIGRAYAAADCLVLPSTWGETWGLVVNEALATGLPCVVSDQVGCAPDLIEDGVTGYQYRMGQVEELAAALQRVRAGNNWGDACRGRVAAYSLEAASAGLVTACRAVRRRRPVHS